MAIPPLSLSTTLESYNCLITAVDEKNRLYGQKLKSVQAAELTPAMIQSVAEVLHDPVAKEGKVKTCLERFIQSLPKMTVASKTSFKDLSLITLAEHCPVVLARITGLWKSLPLAPVRFDVPNEALDIFIAYIESGKLEEEQALQQTAGLLSLAYEWQEVSLIEKLTLLVRAHKDELEVSSIGLIKELAEHYQNLPLSFIDKKHDSVRFYPGVVEIVVKTKEDLEQFKALRSVPQGLYALPFRLEVKTWVAGLEELLQSNNALQEVVLDVQRLTKRTLIALLAALGKNAKLEKLTLKQLTLSQDICQGLAGLFAFWPNLLSFDLSGCEVEREGCDELVKGLKNHPNLETLILAKNSVEMFSIVLSRLASLNLSNTKLRGESLSWLDSLPCLRSLDLSSCPLERVSDAFFYFLETTRTLSELKLNNATIDNDSLFRILKGLFIGKTVAIVELEGIKIDDHAADFLSAQLVDNGFLRELNLSNCSLSLQALSQLFGSLSQNRELTVLDIGSQALQVRAIELLAQALCQNTTLITLGLSATGLTDATLLPILEAIKNHPSIKLVNLYGNALSIEAKEALAKRQDIRFLV